MFCVCMSVDYAVLPVRVTCKSFDFYCCCCTFKNMSCSPICSSFCIVFASILAYVSILTHPNRSAPSCIHLCHFLSTLTKHDVRGNFPGHMTPNPALQDPKCPLLALFLCSSCPLRPTTPIRTHPHPFATVYTRLHPKLQSIRYNLIKK